MAGLRVKRIPGFFVLFCMALMLVSCGSRETLPPSPSGGEEPLTFLNANGGKGIEVTVERSDFYDVAAAQSGRAASFLGMQFYQGEPVQLWAARLRQGAGGEKLISVFLYRQDGTEEVCLESVDYGYGKKVFFLDSGGCLYTRTVGDDGDTVLKLDREGNVLYKVSLRHQVKGACELADGRVAVLVNDYGQLGSYAFILLEADGNYTTVKIAQKDIYDTYYLGTSEEGLLLAKRDQIYRVNLGDGTLEPLFSFRQTSYALATGIAGAGRVIKAFRIREDGSLSVLRSDGEGRGQCEELCLAEPDRRSVLVLRGRYIENLTWFKEQLFRFNSTNEKYRVVVETCEEWEDEEAFIVNTGIEIATGGGPDILMGYTMLQSPYSVIEKGGLADLTPLMTRSGIKEEDYLPTTFDLWRTEKGIYSVTFCFEYDEEMFSAQVLGDMEHPDIESVADAMLAYSEPAFYRAHPLYDAAGVLRELLQGSETLWGAVDWEKSSCDFGGELFGRLLQVAKRYGYDPKNLYPEITKSRLLHDIRAAYQFRTRSELLKEGYVPVGVLTDDGCHPKNHAARFCSLAINANSSNREGAWEFLSYLLSEEAQATLPKEISTGYVPVKKSVVRTALEQQIGAEPYMKTVIRDPLTKERADIVMESLENMRALPCRTEAIIDIVLEESQSYFDGTKDIPQVVDIIENRVNLYLQERKK